ncbi:hypothetical protein MNBD_ALPHA09-1941 [hydrothermal vent metagenome]|uniref:HTH marR-type domain-containing protein n=1 Tax=hydrothermal vent metagenome TaxID=652676 RepID=A0A3B0SYI4_9ZZZZ
MSEPQTSETYSLDGSVTHLLHRAGQIVDEVVTSELEKLKVTPRQFTLLVAIEANSGATQVELVEITGTDRSTMAEMTRRLVVRGLIEKRLRDGDNRATALKLSSAGKRLLKQCRSAVCTAEEKFLERISPTRRKSLMTILTAVIAGPKTPAKPKRPA